MDTPPNTIQQPIGAHRSKQSTSDAALHDKQPTESLATTGTVVYAKVPYWPKWPAVVCDREQTPFKGRKTTNQSIVVRFFGTNKFCLVKPDSLSKYEHQSTTNARLQTAIKQAQEYIDVSQVATITSRHRSKPQRTTKHVNFQSDVTILPIYD